MFNVYVHLVRLVGVMKADKMVDDRANMTDGIVFQRGRHFGHAAQVPQINRFFSRIFDARDSVTRNANHELLFFYFASINRFTAHKIIELLSTETYPFFKSISNSFP